jgi:nucleoid DNA-binding protein
MGRLTIQEIAKVLVTKNGLEQKVANRFVTELFAIIQERLEKNDLIKVKGLGTWKVITVDARESVSVRTGDRVMIEEHSKITFTPDAMMKELVNKPFSQFETVILNDNVEFDDLKELPDDSDNDDNKDDFSENEPEQLEQNKHTTHKQEQTFISQERPAIPREDPFVVPQEPPVISQEEPLVEAVEKQAVEDDIITVAPTVSESVADVVETPAAEVVATPAAEVVSETVDAPSFEKFDEPQKTESVMSQPAADDEEEEEKANSLFKWLWIALGAICLAGLSAAGGYYYGCQHMPLATLSDTVFVRDTIYVPEIQDTAIVDAYDDPVQQDAEMAETPMPEEADVEQPKAEPAKASPSHAEKPKAEPDSEIDNYAAKDERVRLGAYRIVGLDHEVKVQPGQTFYSICRAHLGPDMECYIEVYNDLPRNPQIKVGQVIKIPKLRIKKRKKQ